MSDGIRWRERKNDDASESKIEHICRLGLHLYLITILDDLPPEALACDNLAAQLKFYLSDLNHHEIPRELHCWLTFLIGITVCNTSCKSWAQKTFASLVQEPVPLTKEELKAQLGTFFWVENIHGVSFNKFWDTVSGQYQSRSRF